MEATLMSLPSELLATILSNLPLQTLLAFSLTSWTNRILAKTALQELHLAILSRDYHGRLALAEHHTDSDSLDFGVVKVLTSEKSSQNLNPTETLRRQVCAQNSIATDILRNELTHNLRTLSLHMYDLASSELASVMATNLSKLRDLSLNFHHSYINDNCISSSYWNEAPAGNPSWNALVGLGAKNRQRLRLRNLRTLRIKRSGLTSAQLRTMVESNPRLKRLSLANVTGVEHEFVQWLGAYCKSGRSQLEEVTLQGCPQLKMQRLDDFAWLEGITDSAVRYLSLLGCKNVRHEMFVSLIDGGDDEFKVRTMETVIPPKGPPRHFGVAEELGLCYSHIAMAAGFEGSEKQNGTMDKIDVDPDYMIQAVTVAA